MPNTDYYTVALRCDHHNFPQIQFNEDGVWHDFSPSRVALKPGPWYPCVVIDATISGDVLSNFRIDINSTVNQAAATGQISSWFSKKRS
jgi:hypothetical protein